MPGWMIAVLKWGGLALALVNGLALLLLGPSEPAPQAADPAAAGTAGGNVGMLLFGLVAAAIGVVADRASRH